MGSLSCVFVWEGGERVKDLVKVELQDDELFDVVDVEESLDFSDGSIMCCNG